MKRRKYSDEFKEQILEECRQVGNVALVARRHEISPNTIYTWIKTARKKGSIKPLPRDKVRFSLKQLVGHGYPYHNKTRQN